MSEGIARLRPNDPERLGPFRLLGVLGNGGAGTVYLGRGAARRGTRKRTAAVRAIRPELLRDRQLRARLREETARISSSVNSPFVAEPLGCELDGDRPWAATRFVPGLPLAALVASSGPLPEKSVRALGGALARALASLHEAETAHGDLRPGNVLLTVEGPCLVDCGAYLGRSLTARDGGGFPHAPADGFGPAARRTEDIFGLGVVLALAASARYPFAGQLPMTREGPDLSGVPATLHAPVLACLHKTPEARPRPEVLARALDLSRVAGRPGREWLPGPHLERIRERARAARSLTARHLLR
ncbi:protein kinase domain-containing protein [Streptomyces albus]|uniref:protein kinase domain-containing protein n=1 Tax=Streptomyces albus TaxID=1888 RepID=UPI003F1B5209